MIAWQPTRVWNNVDEADVRTFLTSFADEKSYANKNEKMIWNDDKRREDYHDQTRFFEVGINANCAKFCWSDWLDNKLL